MGLPQPRPPGWTPRLRPVSIPRNSVRRDLEVRKLSVDLTPDDEQIVLHPKVRRLLKIG